QRALEGFTKPQGSTRDSENLVAVSAVVGFGRHGNLRRRALVEPPEKFGDTEWPALLTRQPAHRLIDRFGLDERARLLPESNFAPCLKKASHSRRCHAAGAPCRSAC